MSQIASSDLSALLQTAPDAPIPTVATSRQVVDLPPITRAGVDLARLVLWLIAAAIVVLLSLVAFEEFRRDISANTILGAFIDRLSTQPLDIHDSTDVDNYQRAVQATNSLLATAGTAKEATRDFMMKLAQLILISIFLPVLTALLGYIFGTQQSGASKQ